MYFKVMLIFTLFNNQQMGTVREHYYMYLQQTKFFNVVFIQGVWVKFKSNLNETGYGCKCNAKYNKCTHGENF